jgi:hypothetical protein
VLQDEQHTLGLSLRSSGEFVCVTSSGNDGSSVGTSPGAANSGTHQLLSDCVFIVGRREVLTLTPKYRCFALPSPSQPPFHPQVFSRYERDDNDSALLDINDDVRPGCVIVLQHALSGIYLGVSPDATLSSMDQALLQPFPAQAQPCWFVVDSILVGDDGSPYICLQSVFSASFLSLQGGMPCVTRCRCSASINTDNTTGVPPFLNVTILPRDPSRSLRFGDIVRIHWPLQKKLLSLDIDDNLVASSSSNTESVDVSFMWRLQPCAQSGPVMASRLSESQPFVLQHLRSGFVVSIGDDGSSCTLMNSVTAKNIHSLNFRSTTVSTASLSSGDSLIIMASNSQPLALSCFSTPPSFLSPSPSDVCVVTHVPETHYRIAVKILMRRRVVISFRNELLNSRRGISSSSEIGDTADVEDALKWLGDLLDKSGPLLPTYQDLMSSSGVIVSIMQLLDDLRLLLSERRAWPWPSRITRLYRHASYLIQAVCVGNSRAATALCPHWRDMIRFCGLGAGFAGALVVVFKAKPVIRDPKVLMQSMFERFQETQSPELVEAISLVTEYVDDNIEIKLLVLNMLLACDSSIPQLAIDKEGKVICKSRKDVSDLASRTLPISHDPLNVNASSESVEAFSSWHLNVFLNVTRLVIALATGSPIGIIRGLRRLTIINPCTPTSIIAVLMQEQAPCSIKTLLADILLVLFVKADPVIQTPTIVRMFCASEYAVMLESPAEFDNAPSFSLLYSHGDGVTTLLLDAILVQLRYHRMGSIVAAAADENKLTLSLLKLLLALLHTNVFGECGRKQLILCKAFIPLLMSMLHGHSDVPYDKADSRYENVSEHATTMAIKVQICYILAHFLNAWVNRLCIDFFDIVSNQDAGLSSSSKSKSAPFFFHRSKINPITDSSRLATSQEIHDALLGEQHLPPFFTTSPDSSKPIPLHDVVADLLRYHNPDLQDAALRLGLQHISLISAFFDTVPRVHHIQCREDAHLAALISHTRLSVLHLLLDFENIALLSIALQNATNLLHVLSGKSLLADGNELVLGVFKSVDARMSLAEAMDVFQQLFAAVEFYHATSSLHNRESDMIEQFIDICYRILIQYAQSEAIKYDTLVSVSISDNTHRLDSWLPRIIQQIAISPLASDLACAILSDRLDVRVGISAAVIDLLVSNLVCSSQHASQGAAKVIHALIVCKGVSIPLQQHKFFESLHTNLAIGARVAEISVEAEAAMWGSVVEPGADDIAVTRQLINCNIVEVLAWLCSGPSPTAAKHANICRKKWTLHALLTCRLLPLVSTNQGNDRLSGRILHSYLLLLDVLYTGVDEMLATVSEYKGISDLIASMTQKFVELFAAWGGAADTQYQPFLLNTLLPFLCHCFNNFPEFVSQHFGSQLSTIKAHAVRIIETVSSSQQRNLRILFDIPAHALTRSTSFKNKSPVDQPGEVVEVCFFPSVLYSDILLQTIAHVLQMKGINGRDKALKAYSSARKLLRLFDAAAIHEYYTSKCDRLDCIVRSLRLFSPLDSATSFECISQLIGALSLSLYLDPKRDLCQSILRVAQGDRRPWKDAHAEVVFITNYAQLGTMSLALQALTSGDVGCEFAALEYLTTIATRFSNQIHVRDLFGLVCLQREFRQVAVRHLRSAFSNVTTMLALSETCRLVGVPQSAMRRAPCYRAFSNILHLLTILGAYNGATNSDTFSSQKRQEQNPDELMIIEVASFMSNLIPFCARILAPTSVSQLTALPDEQFLSMLQSAMVAVAVDIDGHIGHKKILLTTSCIVDTCALLEELATFAAHCNSDHSLRQPVQALAIACLRLLRILFNDEVPEAAYGAVRISSIFKIVDVLLKDVDGDRQSFILNDAADAFNFPVRYPAIVHALIVLKRLHAHDPMSSSVLSQIMFRPALQAFSNVITSVEVAAPDKSRILVFFPISRAASVYMNSHRHRNMIESLHLDTADRVHGRRRDVIRHIVTACIDIQARSRFLKTSVLEILFGRSSGLLFISMFCIFFLNLLLFFSEHSSLEERKCLSKVNASTLHNCPLHASTIDAYPEPSNNSTFPGGDISPTSSVYGFWQRYIVSHVGSIFFVMGCVHLTVSILRLVKYVVFDFVSDHHHHHPSSSLSSSSTSSSSSSSPSFSSLSSFSSSPLSSSSSFTQREHQKSTQYRDGSVEYAITFTTSEITSSYMFQRLKARVNGIQGMTAWCRVEVEFMSQKEDSRSAQQPVLSGRCSCRLVDVGEVEGMQLDIEGDSVLLSSVIIQNSDSGRCWKSSGNEVWLHPGSPIHIPVSHSTEFPTEMPLLTLNSFSFSYFRLFITARSLLLMVNIAISAGGTFWDPMFFVLLYIDVALHLPLVRQSLLFFVSLCAWPILQLMVLVIIVIFLFSAWVFLKFRDLMQISGYRYVCLSVCICVPAPDLNV